MSDSTQQVRDLLAAAAELPTSNTRLAIEEEAVRVADTFRNVALGMEARQWLMWTANILDRGDILATAFAWRIAQHDREPARYRVGEVLEQYRWVINRLANIHDVSRATLEQLLADYGIRLDRAGFSRRIWYDAQQMLARDFGDPELAASAFRSLRDQPRDGLCRSVEVELAQEIETELFLGNSERALQLGRPFLDGKLDQRMYAFACSHLLLPLLERKRVAEAVALNNRCLHAYNPKRMFDWWFGNLLKFSALSGDLDRAARMFSDCQHAMTPFFSGLQRLQLSLDAIVVFDRLIAVGTRELTIRLPEGVPVPHEHGRYSVQAMRDWLGRDAGDWADRFDARNGNTYFRNQLETRGDLQRWAVSK